MPTALVRSISDIHDVPLPSKYSLTPLTSTASLYPFQSKLPTFQTTLYFDLFHYFYAHIYTYDSLRDLATTSPCFAVLYMEKSQWHGRVRRIPVIEFILMSEFILACLEIIGKLHHPVIKNNGDTPQRNDKGSYFVAYDHI